MLSPFNAFSDFLEEALVSRQVVYAVDRDLEEFERISRINVLDEVLPTLGRVSDHLGTLPERFRPSVVVVRVLFRRDHFVASRVFLLIREGRRAF